MDYEKIIRLIEKIRRLEEIRKNAKYTLALEDEDLGTLECNLPKTFLAKIDAKINELKSKLKDELKAIE